MATARVKGEFLLTDDNGAIDPIEFDKTIAHTQKEKKLFVIPPGTRKIIWDPTDEESEAATDFDIMFLQVQPADAVVDVQFTGSKSASPVARFSFRVIDNIPLILGADDTFGVNSVTATFTASRVNNIDYLVAVNRSTNSITAQLTLVLAT